MAKNRKKFTKDQLITVPKRIIQPAEEDLASQYDRRVIAHAHTVQNSHLTVIVRRKGAVIRTLNTI